MKYFLRAAAATVLVVVAYTATILGIHDSDRILVGFVQRLSLVPIVLLTAGIAVVDTVRVCRFIKDELLKK